MPTTAEEYAAAKAWVGDWEDKDAFDTRYDRLDGDLDAAIVESIRAHRSELLSQAAQLSVEDISIGTSENIRALSADLEKFEGVGGGVTGGGAINVTKLSRQTYR